MRRSDIDRRRRAIDAAIRVADAHGVTCSSATVLQDSNNTVLHLAPAPLVAKVATGHRTLAAHECEVRIALHLASSGAPVVPLSNLLPPGPHVADGFSISFWQYYPHDGGRAVDPRAAGTALCLLHDALATYPHPLPPFTDKLIDVRRLLDDDALLPDLPDRDRQFLRSVYREVDEEIRRRSFANRLLHGEPHLGNCLSGKEGVRWIDFEAVCAGPLEADLAALPGEALTAFSHFDPHLLRLMRRMGSLCVATWCWTDPGRATVLREAAEHHLRLLRDG